MVVDQYPKLVDSKTAANDVVTIEYNPAKDLLATVFSNGALTCSRMDSLQKVWHKEPCGKIVSVAWRPDGRALAIAAYNEDTKEHICTLHDIEDGKEVNSVVTSCGISSISWFSCTSLKAPKEEHPTKSAKKDQSNIDSKICKAFSHQLAHNQTKLNILMIATSDGKVGLHALGLYYLGNINVHNEPNTKIIKTHMSKCMRFVTAVVVTHHSNYIQASEKVLKVDLFQDRSEEILRVAKIYAKITDELEYFEDTLSAVTSSWTDVLAGLDHKLSSYCSRQTQKPDESHNGYTFISADDLLQLLVLGYPSDNLEKFLSDMSDKGLRKLNSAIELTCLRVQNLIVKNAQKCCYHMHSDLNLLRGMSLWHERFGGIGLDDKFIVNAMRNVGSLMLKLTELQQVIDHSLKSTKSFFRWLISISCRLACEQNTAVQNDINKTTQQDIQLITDFILENFDYNSQQDEFASFQLKSDIDFSTRKGDMSVRPTCSNFTLEQVGQYLKNEPLSRLKYSFAKPGSNFWIEFFKERPELTEPKLIHEDGSSVLLFYPHNPDTSLIQEYKKCCKSVQEAFKVVAINIESTLSKSAAIINLKDFLKNAPTHSIRVETDIDQMQHYTMFRMKQNSNKLFLISQSLANKSFKLTSIEFHATMQSPTLRASTSRSSSSIGTIVIADACFFSGEDCRELSIMFLLIDQTYGDTIIVRTEMSKLSAGVTCVERSQRDLSKIFRTMDSIEKFSSSVVLKLDLYTQLPDRKHDPDMMVKKIKGVIGNDIFTSGSRGIIAFTSCANKRLHLYELDDDINAMADDITTGDEKIDESLIDNDLFG